MSVGDGIGFLSVDFVRRWGSVTSLRPLTGIGVSEHLSTTSRHQAGSSLLSEN